MTDEIDRTLPDGIIFQDKSKLRYPEEIMTDRIEALTAEIERLRELLVRGHVVCDGDDDDAVAFRTDVRAAIRAMKGEAHAN